MRIRRTCVREGSDLPRGEVAHVRKVWNLDENLKIYRVSGPTTDKNEV